MGAFDWRTFIARLPERIWFRLVLFAAAALALVAIAAEAGPYLPDALAVDFGQDAALRILQILASSMLAVTTFSLTAMISAYASAAHGTTPRATQLLISDRTSQNALSTFLGTFVFAIVGVLALSTTGFGERGRSVLLIGTLVVIALVVATLLRWIHHLTRFGRVPDVIDRVERAAADTIATFVRTPHLGGMPAVGIPDDAHPVRCSHVGHVTGIDMAHLQQVASHAGVRVHVAATPGSFVGSGAVLAHVTGDLDGEHAAAIAQAFRVERHRTYEQDPRLGVIAMAEIGSRALSPAVNDPGTAIEVLGALQRLLTQVLTADPAEAPVHDLVHVPAVTLEDLLQDALRPLARDGSDAVEVGLRIQRVLADLVALARSDDDVAVLRAASMKAAGRAARGLSDPDDIAVIEAASLEVQRQPRRLG